MLSHRQMAKLCLVSAAVLSLSAASSLPLERGSLPRAPSFQAAYDASRAARDIVAASPRNLQALSLANGMCATYSSPCCNLTQDLARAVNAAAPNCPASPALLAVLSNNHLLLMPNDTLRMAQLDKLCVASCWGPVIAPILSRYAAMAATGMQGCVESTFLAAQLQMACLRDSTTGQFCHQVLSPLESQLVYAQVSIMSSSSNYVSPPPDAMLAAPCASSCIASATAIYGATSASLAASGISRDISFNISRPGNANAALGTAMMMTAASIPRLLHAICMPSASGGAPAPRCGSIAVRAWAGFQ